MVTEKERCDRLRLARSARIGPITYRALMGRFGHASAALEAVPELSRNGGAALKLAPPAVALAELEKLSNMGGRLMTYGEQGYPPALMSLEDAPPVLAVIGDIELSAKETVAIVGARNASAGGRRLARDWGRELGKAGFVVASGLARGIDRAAHVGGLDSGTVAVMAGGVDVVYPEENRDIYEKISATGALVSEVPFGTKPTARHFPRRNRIISGLSLGVVIVEAAQRSGSLITARMAAEQGREVMCVPGSPLDPRARGPNRLIRDGATLVQEPGEVIEALRPMIGRSVANEMALPEIEPAESPNYDDSELAQARRLVGECLSPHAVTVDEILRECQLSAPMVFAVLLEFELAGRISRQPGGRVAAV